MPTTMDCLNLLTTNTMGCWPSHTSPIPGLRDPALDVWEGSSPSFPMHLWISQDTALFCSTPQHPNHPTAPCPAQHPAAELHCCPALRPALAQPYSASCGTAPSSQLLQCPWLALTDTTARRD